MKKAFTLVELLTVIIVLGIVIAIAIPVVTGVISESRENAYNEQVSRIVTASNQYAVTNNLGYIEEFQILRINDLVTTGLLTETPINPIDNDEFSCVLYKWDNIGETYIFEVKEDDKDCLGPLDITLSVDGDTNKWFNKNIIINVDTNGHPYKYCIGNYDCVPNTDGDDNIVIATESASNYVNIIASNYNNPGLTLTSNTGPYKLDKTNPILDDMSDLYIDEGTVVNNDLLLDNVNYYDSLSLVSHYEISSLDTSVPGIKTIEYKIYDNASNFTSKNRNVIVGSEPPSVDFNVLDNTFNINGWANKNFNISITTTDYSNTGIKSLKWCSTTGSSCIPTVQSSNIVAITTESTSNKICVEVVDNLNQVNNMCSSNYKLDKTNPIIEGVGTLDIDVGDSLNLSNGVNFTDSLSGISGDLSITPSTLSTSVVGTYQINYSVTDLASNTTTVSRSIVIGSPAPDIAYTVAGSPFNSNGWSKTNVTVTVNASDNSGTGVKEVKWCSTTGSSCTPINKSSNIVTLATSSASNKICAQATDNYNQTSSIICSDVYKIDKVLPTAGTANITGTTGTNGWYKSNVTISASNGSDSLSGHSTTTTSRTSVTWNTTGVVTTITTTDKAGNTSTRNYTIKIDKSVPSVPTSEVRRNNSTGTIVAATTTYYNSPLWWGNPSATDSGHSGISHYEFSYGCVEPNGTMNSDGFIYNGRAVSRCLRAVDEAGNVSAWSSRFYMWSDVIAPSVPTAVFRNTNSSGTVLTNLTSNIWRSYSVYATMPTSTDSKDPNLNESGMSGIARYEYSFNCSTVSGITTGPYTYSNSNINFCMRSVDKAGNVSAWSPRIYIKIDKIIPTLIAKSNQTVIQGTSVDPKTYFNTPTYGISGQKSYSCNVTNISSLTTGTHTVTCTVTSNAGLSRSTSVSVVVSSPEYVDDSLNGGTVDLGVGMIPVKIEDDGTVLKADLTEEWYNYNERIWANAVVVNDPTYIVKPAGTEIPETVIEQMYVWIPRYQYQIFDTDTNNDDGEEEEIIIEFVDVSVVNLNSEDPERNSWYVHPAFTIYEEDNDNIYALDELSGFWVGKFEVTNEDEDEKFEILPHKGLLEGYDVDEIYANILAFNNQNGLSTDSDVHMMKNMEWGAIAYLSHSQYGTCIDGDGTCDEVDINDAEHTGHSDFRGRWDYGATTNDAYETSTNLNISGIFDIAGGQTEVVMGAMSSSYGESYPSTAGTGFTYDDKFEYKYLDLYEYGIDADDYDRGFYGDATRETTYWYLNEAEFVRNRSLHHSGWWFLRGRDGIFAFELLDEDAYKPTYVSSRAIIWVSK